MKRNNFLPTLLSGLVGFLISKSVAADTGYKLDLSIEGMQSQKFSQGVFIFMLVGVVVFCVIIYTVAHGKHAPSKMKTGERVMFVAIILGVIGAVVFGATQMLEGYLF